MNPEKLLTIESGFVLTGLGVLVRDIPDEAAQQRLRQFALHSALAVVLVFADGTELTATASVEEITRASPTNTQVTLTEYALLLQLPDLPELPPAGTEVWLTNQLTPSEWL
ncbi:hypothetical protein [Hymenobacter lucidus]|uniref:Uncharacterized protein n=1 Tax=Hymenobacter lucidus TaxID=2880930 RepID=A0ABS8AUJ6_9BACT|nr:hypothetical protein [Hymenobacter lucidus]MCB2409248.1 hypothetical protein [Hymenobacter lucidus]